VHIRTKVAGALFSSVLLSLSACSSEDSVPTGPSGPTNLEITEVTVGTGATAVNGDTVTVHYIGAFLNGQTFDSSYQAGAPITFQTGVGAVIPGFEQGIIGMKVGGRRLVVIPANLAYGAAGRAPTIPPNTPLQFQIDLVSIAGK
jgi:FKBP-type peptidyl-prolyl cis-trans isomerase